MTGQEKVAIIQRVVAESFNLSVKKMLSRKRPEYIAWPRQIAMSLSYEFSGLSTPKIGICFDRHHGAVLSAIDRVHDRYFTEPQSTRKIIDTLSATIRELLENNPN